MRHPYTSDRVKIRAATIALAALLALTGVLGAASSAFAGYWLRDSCVTATNEGWASFAAGGPGYGSTSNINCDPNTPMVAALSSAAAAPVGAQEGLVYTPPAGSMLVGGYVSVGLLADGSGYNASGVAAVYSPTLAYDASNVLKQCAWGLGPCSPGSSPNLWVGSVAIPPNRGGNVYVVASCGGNAGWACNAGGSQGTWSRVFMYDARLLLFSAVNPIGSEFRGSLLAPGAHGTATLSFVAGVASGPGIYNVTVTIDGKTVYDATPDSNFGKCVGRAAEHPATGAHGFDVQQPCPLSTRVDLSVPTTGLRDGEHALKIVVSDAAQNTQTVLNQTITTNNRTTPNSALGADEPSPGAASDGSPATPEPLYANVLDPATQNLLRGRVRRAWRHSALALSGTLRNSTGIPAPAVPVVLLGRNGGVGEWAVLARSAANAAGHWTLTAPRGPSRTLAIAYGTRATAAGPGVVTIRQTVTPGLSLTVGATQRGALSFRGRLQIKPLGSPRPLVIIQVRGRRGGWQAVPGSPVRVDEHGAYRLLYRADRRAIGRNYRFRAVAPGTPLAATATSPIRRAVAR